MIMSYFLPILFAISRNYIRDFIKQCRGKPKCKFNWEAHNFAQDRFSVLIIIFYRRFLIYKLWRRRDSCWWESVWSRQYNIKLPFSSKKKLGLFLFWRLRIENLRFQWLHKKRGMWSLWFCWDTVIQLKSPLPSFSDILWLLFI